MKHEFLFRCPFVFFVNALLAAMLLASEPVKVVTGPAVVLRHHDPGEPQPVGLFHHLFRGQGAIGATHVGVDMEVKYGIQVVTALLTVNEYGIDLPKYI